VRKTDDEIRTEAAAAAQGHSGFSARQTLALFNEVARFKALTPLTDDPDEWVAIDGDMLADKKTPVWQSRRQSSCFSEDGGKTHYDIDAGDDCAVKSSAASMQVGDALKVTPRPA
jgi:hypothetical protein